MTSGLYCMHLIDLFLDDRMAVYWAIYGLGEWTGITNRDGYKLRVTGVLFNANQTVNALI